MPPAENEKICNGNVVRYSHEEYGTLYLPLEDRPNSTGDGITNFHDRNKHPLWLAELLAGAVYDLHTDVPQFAWNVHMYDFATQIHLRDLEVCTFSHHVWDLLQDFFDDYKFKLQQQRPTAQSNSHDSPTPKKRKLVQSESE